MGYHSALQIWFASRNHAACGTNCLRSFVAYFSAQTKRNRRALGLEPPSSKNISITGPRDTADVMALKASSPGQRRIVMGITRAIKKRDWAAVCRVFEEVKENPDPIVCNAMLHAADKCDKFTEAFQIYADFFCMKGNPRQATTYTPLIRLAGRHGQLDRARSLLTEMREFTIAPNAHTCSALVDGCKAAGDNDGAWLVWQEMKAAGVGVDEISLSAIMSVVAKSGDALATEVLLQEADGKFHTNVTHMNCILDACKRSGDVDTALRVLQTHRRRNLEPDIISYTCLLGAVRRAGRPSKDVDSIMEQMHLDKVAPNRFFVEEHVAYILGVPLDSARIELLLKEQPEAVLQAAARIIEKARNSHIQLSKLTRDIDTHLQAALSHPRGEHDWVQVLMKRDVASCESQSVYYWDRVTGRTQWERPPAPVTTTVTQA